MRGTYRVDGDVLGEVTGKARRRLSDDQSIPYEEQWETNMDAFQALKVYNHTISSSTLKAYRRPIRNFGLRMFGAYTPQQPRSRPRLHILVSVVLNVTAKLDMSLLLDTPTNDSLPSSRPDALGLDQRYLTV